MPTQHDMGPDSHIYRAVLEFDYQPTEWIANPAYTGPSQRGYFPANISVPCGPIEVRERMIGPYQSIAPIKAYVTRHRGHQKNNLRLIRIERVSAWEEVDI